VRMSVLVCTGRSRPLSCGCVRVTMFMRMAIRPAGLVRMLVPVMRVPVRVGPVLLRPVLLPRHILLTVHPDVHFRGRDATANHPGDLQLCPELQTRNRLFEHLGRDSGVHQSAKKHIARNARKTFKIRNAHRASIVSSRESSVLSRSATSTSTLTVVAAR
jgi:hypothetical protein